MGLSKVLTVLCLAVVMTLIWHPTAAKAQAIEEGLAGHWTFDEKDTDAKEAKDALGEHNATIEGKPEIVEGKVGEALSFNGKEDYVVMGPVTEGQDLTYALWIKVEKLPAGSQVVIWDDDSNGGGDSWIQLMPDGTLQTQRGGDGFGVFNSKTPIEPGEWTHITFVSDEKNSKKIIYLNGKPDAEADGLITSRTNVSHVVVALGHDGNRPIIPQYFEGAVDDVAIYLRALSEQEVKKNVMESAAVDYAGKLSITWGTIKTR
ncbi:TPA: LamG domain-containing protein [Candidatus Poribacteria bacterium]|nr:LamG domain-containing protein [Candidatus Poribacteria bacterium]